MLQPVMDPLRRLQGGLPGEAIESNDHDRTCGAVDRMGGDHAPGVNLKGARDILAENSEIESIFLTGPADQLKKAAAESGLTDPRAIFIDAPEAQPGCVGIVERQGRAPGRPPGNINFIIGVLSFGLQ